MPKLRISGNSVILAVPTEILKIKGWKPGTLLLLTIDEKTGNVILREVPKQE